MNGVSRFLSRKDKKKAPVKTELSKDIYHLLHIHDYWKKKASKEEEKQMQDIIKRLEALKITNFKESHIEYALRSSSARGNADKAFDLLVLFHETVTGQLAKSDPTVHMLGAENREMVSCYLDSLLFAMFARLDSFESILSVEFPDAATNTLATILRFWVNMLRTGRLITTDITRHLQDALADSGWSDARRVAQQDVSEAFSFITDKLALPLLTLKMDVYHTGKEVNDDHRIVRERLLQVAIPENPEEGTEIRLEDCLESYFNNKVEVKRHLQRRNTVNERPSSLAKPVVLEAPPESGSKSKESIFRHHRMDASSSSESSRIIRDDIDVHLGRKDSNRGLVFKKEVLMPAWQFFHLIPWFNLKSSAHLGLTTDAQVAAHFATKRPVLGICLKRYNVSPQGAARRVNTYIDIPLEIRLPHFISDGSEDDGFGSSFSKFQLSLKSIICHRGVSLDTGHYVSIVRPTNEEIGKFPEGEGEIEPKYKWLLFDDLSKERVHYVDVRKALKDECPYLVFYQVQLIDEYADSEDGLPPSYAEATNGPPSPNSKFAVSEPTIGLPSTTSTSTIVGTSAFSTPALLSHVISAPDKPSSLAEALRADLDDQSSTSQPSHSILAIPSPNPKPVRRKQATTAPVSAQSSPVAHPELNPPRPHSLDLSPLAAAVTPSSSTGGAAGARGRSPSGRASQESSSRAGVLRGSLRSSVVFSDGSSLGTAPSAPVTPFDDALGISTGGARAAAPEGYLSAKDGSAGAQPPAATPKAPPAGTKREGKRGRRRGRSKEDGGGKEKETRSSRVASSARSWLPSRSSPRPRSQPPPAAAAGVSEANRRSVAGMSGFVFKGLREAMGRESKAASATSVAATAVVAEGEKGGAEGEGAANAAATTAAEEAAAAAAVGEGAVAVVAAADAAGDAGSGTLRAKRAMGLGRRKSAKKGKARKEGSPGRVELEGPDRQCVAM